jgi:hypothetical protein
VFDGRFANNAWLQELPHPITRSLGQRAGCAKAADELSWGER